MGESALFEAHVRKGSMSVWFEGKKEIDCGFDRVVEDIDGNVGEYFAGVVGHMPGLSTVDLVEAKPHAVTIRTNEGLMKRHNIVTRFDNDSATIEFDEKYEAGSKVTVRSHSLHRFVATDHGVMHHLVVRDVVAPGILGFFYRKFGSSKIGNALLTAEKSHFERSAG